MSRLRNLINILENLHLCVKAGLEDATEIVQQYWDDVSTDVIEATDQELASELGVSRIALAELLEPMRHTFQYANIGGISSVRGYDHGDDWFLAEFSDGSRYLYTTKSTTPESIGYMRKYAQEGKGLNSYIMRVQRANYAGRNVKGVILIKPGMEQYNPAGYKRLQLLKAFENTMTHPLQKKFEALTEQAGKDGLDPTAQKLMAVGKGLIGAVSNEGIFDKLKSLFSESAKENKKSPDPDYKELDWVVEEANRVIKNKPDTFHAVEIDNGYSNFFLKNGSYNPNWINGLNTDIQKYKKLIKDLSNYNKSKIIPWQNKYRPILEDFSGDNQRAEEFVKVFQDYVNAQPKPWSQVFHDSNEWLGYGKQPWIEDGDFVAGDLEGTAPVTIPQQDASRVKQIVSLMVDIGDVLYDIILAEDTVNFYGDDFTDSPFRGYSSDPKVQELTNKMTIHAHANNNPIDHLNAINDRVENILRALAQYVRKASN